MRNEHSGKKQQLREEIAHLAARVMAEDGVTDFASAKRKAARMAGVPDTRSLPNNDEIEQALRQYQQLYQASAHQGLIEKLRAHALELMRLLVRFNPHLTGSVLAGYAGKNSDINLQLFTESVKDVEMFLIDQGWDYESQESRVYVGNTLRLTPTFVIDREGCGVTLAVFSYDDLRQRLRQTSGGKLLARANLSQAEALFEGLKPRLTF